jgi:hypothetical protein
VRGWALSLVVSQGVERERASAQPRVRPPEPQLRVPRKGSNCKSPAKLCLNSAFSNPCRCPSLASQVPIAVV